MKSIPTPIVAFVLGLVMALALGLGGMTQPSKVVGFLDFFGHFDPSLAFVMGGAVGVHAIAYRLIMRRRAPVLADHFDVPHRTVIDRRLVIGSAMFGIGWGISGFCPGPALVSAGSFAVGSLVFVGAMVGGQLALDALDGALSRSAARKAADVDPEAAIDG